jgi:Transposase
MEEPIMQNDTRIAVDVAKSVLEIAVSDRPGHVVRRERQPRAQFLEFFANHPAATVFMEACGSAHFWGRRILDLGHRVILLPPRHVRPYIRGNKTDRTDAKGILEASRNEDIHPVPVKTVAQQVLTSLHRMRSAWMTERTARLNTLRGQGRLVHSWGRMFGQVAALGGHRPVSADVRTVLGTFRDLLVVLSRSPVLRAAVPPRGADREPARLKSAAPAE